MKTLELNQMEDIEGGSWSCVAGIGGLALTAIALTAAGPVGWVGWGVMIGRGVLTGGSLEACAYDLTH